MGVSVVSPVSEIVRLTCAHSPRVALFTDISSREGVPEPIREVVDDIPCGDLSRINAPSAFGNIDGAVVWCEGEWPAAGSPADWRRTFFSRAACNTCVAIHWPFLEHADLLGLEPRLLRPGTGRAVWNPSLRIAGSRPSEKRKAAWRASGQGWARHSLALWRELEKPGSGLDDLLGLWNSKSEDARFSSLLLRNLIGADEVQPVGKSERAAGAGKGRICRLRGISLPARRLLYLAEQACGGGALFGGGPAFPGRGIRRQRRRKFLPRPTPAGSDLRPHRPTGTSGPVLAFGRPAATRICARSARIAPAAAASGRGALAASSSRGDGPQRTPVSGTCGGISSRQQHGPRGSAAGGNHGHR